jgi:nicotinate-nucleotide adenylyltransferase
MSKIPQTPKLFWKLSGKLGSKLCLGGSFNPIHLGHLICARAAAEAVGATGVVLIPSAIPPHKQGDPNLASAEDRLKMCRLAIEGVEGFEVDDREIRCGGASYTIATVRELKSEGWQKVAWLIGSDMLATLPTWREPAELLAEAHFVIMARPGSEMDWNTLPKELAALEKQVVTVPQIDISATEIRRRIKVGQAIDFLTPPAVVDYIRAGKLYVGGEVVSC